jgi:hypothetical protein
MASSSNRRRASSTQEASAAKARVISIRRADALPRKGNVPASRRKPVADPPTDAPAVSPATVVVDSNKRARRPQQAEALATRTKTARGAGRASGKLNGPALTEVMPVAAAEVVPAPAALEIPAVEEPTTVDTEEVVEVSAIMEEATIAEASLALPVEAVARPTAEVEQLPVFEKMRGPSLAPTAADSAAPAPPTPDDRKPALEAVVLRLLSMLRRWIGVRW